MLLFVINTRKKNYMPFGLFNIINLALCLTLLCQQEVNSKHLTALVNLSQKISQKSVKVV